MVKANQEHVILFLQNIMKPCPLKSHEVLFSCPNHHFTRVHWLPIPSNSLHLASILFQIISTQKIDPATLSRVVTIQALQAVFTVTIHIFLCTQA